MTIYGDYVSTGQSGAESETGIVGLNPGINGMLLQATRPVNPSSWAYLNKTKPVVFLHLSDVHGDGVETARAVQLHTKYASMIDDAILTGDMVRERWSDGISFWTGVSGTNKILVVIGNHDVLTSSGYDWTQRATQADQYSRYIAPNVSNWGVEYTSGKTYYYKDYAAKKLRLIVINCILQGADLSEQLTWFESAVSGARSKGYTVVASQHYPIGSSQDVACNFSAIDVSVAGDGWSNEDFLTVIDSHISSGGKFACWLAGHEHVDGILKSPTHSNQLCICVDALCREQANQYSDTQRTDNTRSQDLLNLTVFDTESTLIKIIRVGANMDRMLRPKNCLTINYSTGEIVTQH